jgi:hypothetical protein
VLSPQDPILNEKDDKSDTSRVQLHSYNFISSQDTHEGIVEQSFEVFGHIETIFSSLYATLKSGMSAFLCSKSVFSPSEDIILDALLSCFR